MNPYERFLEGKDPLKTLAATPARLKSLVKGLTPAQLARRVNKDKWSIHEILAHLADCEVIFTARCRWIAFEDNPTLTPFDQDKWSNGRQREKEPAAETLERFRVLRQAQLRLFRSTPKADFERAGQHLERGRVTLGLTMRTAAGHDINHLGQIEALRTALRAKKS